MKRKDFNRKHLACDIAMLTLGAALASGALAQDSWSIEEIVVTAQKRVQSTQDIGVAVSAFSGADIKEMGGGTIKDVAAQTPGLSTANAQSGGAPIFSIRGVGLDDFNLNNASAVGVYIDQVYASSPAFLTFQMLDVAAVEVLKGPQGTLYGKNATGGAITFVSNKPTDDFEASVSASYGRFDETKVEAYVSGPLSDSVRGRLAATTVQGGEYQKDVGTGRPGEKYGESDQTSFRGLLAIDVSDDTEVLIDVHGGEDKSTPAQNVINPDNDLLGVSQPGGFLNDATDFGPRKVASAVDVTKDDSGFGAAVTVTSELDFATFTAIAAYDEYDAKNEDNYGARDIHIMTLHNDLTAEQTSLELRLTSNNDSDFTWVAGINVSEETNQGLTGTNPGDFVEIAYSAFGVTATDGTTADDYVDTIYDQNINSFGLYAHTETHLNDEFKLTIGARYSHDELDYDADIVDNGSYDATGLSLGNGIGAFSFLPSGSVFATVDIDEKEDSLDGKIALDYTPNEQWLYYASVSTGYKGGRVYAGAAPSSQYYFYAEPEQLTAYELGFKGTLLDDTLQLNGAVYRYDYKDRQSFIVDTAFAVVLANVPESEVEGAELDFWWRPLQGLDVKGGVAYMNTKVTEQPTSADLNGLVALSQPNALSQAPEWSYNLVVGYGWDLSDSLSAKATMDYSWKDETIASVSDSESWYGPVKSLGVRFAITPLDETWELALWGRNITDEDEAVFAQSTFIGEAFQTLQKPATYGLEFTYNWH